MFKSSVLIFCMNILSACIFLGLSVWLLIETPGNSVFETWSESVVIGGNANVSNTIAALNSSLTSLCTGAPTSQHSKPRMSLPPVFFSLNDTAMKGSVFCTSTDTTYDSVVLMGLVLCISCGFHMWRAAFWEPPAENIEGAHYSSVQEQGAPGLLYNIECPDFARWLEYTITAPLQIIVVCGTVYMRNSEQITLISTLQGALTLCGWTIELFIWHLQIASHKGGKFSAAFNAVLAKLAAVFAAAAYMHYVIWSMLLAIYQKHKHNLLYCDLGLKTFPTVIQDIITLQFVLFTAFGVVPLLQTGSVLLLPAKQTQHIWLLAAVLYAILSVVSKCSLALMFVKLIVDGNCIDTNSGHACLY